MAHNHRDRVSKPFAALDVPDRTDLIQFQDTSFDGSVHGDGDIRGDRGAATKIGRLLALIVAGQFLFVWLENYRFSSS